MIKFITGTMEELKQELIYKGYFGCGEGQNEDLEVGENALTYRYDCEDFQDQDLFIVEENEEDGTFTLYGHE